jgi:hypothetical protein
VKIDNWTCSVCAAAIASLGAAMPQPAAAHGDDCQDDSAHDTVEARATAKQLVAWQHPSSKNVKQPIAG